MKDIKNAKTAEQSGTEKRKGQDRAETGYERKAKQGREKQRRAERSKVEQRGRAKSRVASRYRVERIGDEINDDKRPTVFRSTYVFIYSYWYNS